MTIEVRGLEPTGRQVVWQQSLRKRRFPTLHVFQSNAVMKDEMDFKLGARTPHGGESTRGFQAPGWMAAATCGSANPWRLSGSLRFWWEGTHSNQGLHRSLANCSPASRDKWLTSDADEADRMMERQAAWLSSNDSTARSCKMAGAEKARRGTADETRIWSSRAI